MKKLIVTRNGDKLTIYPFEPKTKLIRDYREKQMESISSKDRFFVAKENMIKMICERDSEEGLISKLVVKSQLLPEIQHFIGSRKGSHDVNQILYEQFFEGKLDNLESYPFRVIGANQDETEYYLPLDWGGIGEEEHSILHIPRSLYLYQLFTLNKIGSLKTVNASDEELIRIIDFNNFNKPQEMSISELQNAEAKLGQARKFMFEIDPDYEEPRSEVNELIKQAEIDKPLFDCVGEHIKKLSINQ